LNPPGTVNFISTFIKKTGDKKPTEPLVAKL